jgi:bifunctional enzyme CysN/CysC
MDLLRVMTCGSVDDGKSTLVGRLLFEGRRLFDDQVDALREESRRFGRADGGLDVALLVDGLAAEREQGITIDVAYRQFATERRRFIVADTPGHEQYTRNMATGASTSDLAVIVVDVRNGVLTQTRRHAAIVALLGIRHVVLAVNKMDLAGFDQAAFDAVRTAFDAFARQFAFETRLAVPISARHGDNVIAASPRTPWYRGPALLEHLETIDLSRRPDEEAFRLPVQWVNRPDASFRGYAGTIAAGRVRAGDPIVVTRTGRPVTVARIVTFDGDVEQAGRGDAVTVTLDADVDVSRGDMLAAPAGQPDVSDQIAAHLIWMSGDELLPGRPYVLKSGTQTVGAAVTELKHRIDIDTFKPLAAKTLRLNDVGFCNLALSEPIAFDPYERNRTTGSFILIDRFTNATAGAGLIRFGLRRAANIHWQPLTVNKDARAGLKAQRPCILWFTGLSGAGKSTIANIVERRLLLMGRHTYLLDGDNVRLGLNRDLGFTDADRVENIRRVAEVARLFVDAGVIVLVSFISPFRAERAMARDAVAPGEFFEIHVDVPLEIAEARDPKGLYKKARAGAIAHFTGIDSPYESPEAPDLRLDTTAADADALAERVIDLLRSGGYLAGQ